MPMGMIAVRESSGRADANTPSADFMFYTYSSHPLACAIADGVLAIMEREHLVERAAEMGARLGAQLKEELSGHPMVGDIRGSGLFWGVELVRDRATRTPYRAGDEGCQSGCSARRSSAGCSSIRRAGWRGRRAATR